MLSQQIISNTMAVLQYIEKEPGLIVGPVTAFLGYIIDFVFRIVYMFTQNNSLGISIILLTIVARTIMLPLGFKSQKSMSSMQRLAPEINKIKERYGTSKDPEIQRKMNAEIQALYAKHKVNPLSGCLPLLVQMPIFIALSYLFRQCYLFIPELNAIYTGLANNILQIDGGEALMNGIALPKLTNQMLEAGFTMGNSAPEYFDNLLKVINKCTEADWQSILSHMSGNLLVETEALYASKVGIETFLGINLLGNSGMAFPGILIPILTAATTFLSSYIMNKTAPSADAQAQSTQKMMMMIMPIMMLFMTVNMSAGVGLYWIISSIYQTAQQYLLHKHYSKDRIKEAVK